MPKMSQHEKYKLEIICLDDGDADVVTGVQAGTAIVYLGITCLTGQFVLPDAAALRNVVGHAGAEIQALLASILTVAAGWLWWRRPGTGGRRVPDDIDADEIRLSHGPQFIWLCVLLPWWSGLSDGSARYKPETSASTPPNVVAFDLYRRRPPRWHANRPPMSTPDDRGSR